ncbi:MAG: TlpA family protein disulfide reductase, partial [Myxococcales bacterium]|nr:TlpA family protein disulfide reductase [Myxococcales bacterium]
MSDADETKSGVDEDATRDQAGGVDDDAGGDADAGEGAGASEDDASEANAEESEGTDAKEDSPVDDGRALIPPPKLAARGGAQRQGPDAATLAALLLFVAIGGLLVFGFAQALVPAAEAQLGAPCRPLNPEPRDIAAPELELEDLAGNPVSLSDFRGKFLVVNFWATWCEPCTREWPDLDQLGQRLADRDDVVVIAIGVDKDKQDLTPYLERMGLGSTPVRVLW